MGAPRVRDTRHAGGEGGASDHGPKVAQVAGSRCDGRSCEWPWRGACYRTFLMTHVTPTVFRDSLLMVGIALAEIRASLMVHGLAGTAARCLRKTDRLTALRRSRRRAGSMPDGFDRAYDVHTRIAMDLRELHEIKRRHGEEHAPTPPLVFRDVMRGLDLRAEDTVFVDLGSGAGRAVLLAAEHPFKAIVGVELSPSLHAVAEANVARYRNPAQRCRDIRLVCADAAAFTLPAEPLVVFLYNPFRGVVMRRVLANIEQSLIRHPRPVTVVHLWPRRETRALFASSRSLRGVDAPPPAAVFRSIAT
jgi:predicted RNA methylase